MFKMPLNLGQCVNSTWDKNCAKLLISLTECNIIKLIVCKLRYGDGAGNTVENSTLVSSPLSKRASCLQCFDTVGVGC